MYEIFEKLCEKSGVTPYRVCKETGITTATISNWKAGRYTPKQDKLQKIADYFNVSVDYLMTGEEKEDGPKYYLNEETAAIAQDITAKYHTKYHTKPKKHVFTINNTGSSPVCSIFKKPCKYVKMPYLQGFFVFL